MRLSEFLALVEIEEPDFRNRLRRGQLPIDHAGRQRGVYTPMEALLTLVAEVFWKKGVGLNRGAAIAADLTREVSRCFAEISESSRLLNEGADDIDEVYGSLVYFAFVPDEQEALAICGTFASVMRAASDAGRPIVQMFVANVSRAAAVLRRRAHDHDIDLDPFWTSCDGFEAVSGEVDACAE